MWPSGMWPGLKSSPWATVGHTTLRERCLGCNKFTSCASVSYLPTPNVTINMTEQTSAVLPVGSLGQNIGGSVTAALGS